MLSKVNLIVYRNFFLAFVILSLSSLVSTTDHLFKIDEVKLDIQFLVFQFIAFKLPLMSYFTLVLIFSFLIEVVAGAPSGFYVLTYCLTLIPVTYLIRKYIYQVGFWIFFFFLLITHSLKIFTTTLLLTTIYQKDYLIAFFSKVVFKEWILNISIALGVYLLLFLTKRIGYSLYILILRIKHL